MTHDLTQAAERLAAVLVRENAALAALDLRGAAGDAGGKAAGRGDIRRCPAGGRGCIRRTGGAGCRTWRRRTVRGWSMRSPCSAASSASSHARSAACVPAPRYGATGAMAAVRASPFSLSARA